MSDRLSSITGGASSLPGIMPPQVNEGAGGFKTTGGSSVPITPGERTADSMNVGVPESQANGKSAEDRTAEQGTMEAFADAKPSPKTIPPADAATPASEPPPEAAPPVDVVVAVSEPPPETTPLTGAAAAVSETSSKTASLSGGEYIGINVDSFDWRAKQDTEWSNQKISAWQCQVRGIQAEIFSRPKEERVECGRKCIAEAYVQLFFPESTKQVPGIKIKEVEDILKNESNERVDTQTFMPGVYGNEDFFKQTADPLRQLITAALERALSSGELSLADDKAVQAFFEKIMMFCAVARGAIAAVANPEAELDKFGIIVTLENPKNKTNGFGKERFIAGMIKEPFGNTFSLSQVRFAQWLIFEDFTRPLSREMFKDDIVNSSFGGSISYWGHINHSSVNMLFAGSGIFRECMETAERLKENPDDLKALAAFTLAMKKFIYTWSQSSTIQRGQAAILEMFIDSVAKYVGFQFKRPEIPERDRTALKQLTELFPDPEKRIIAGSRTDTEYTVKMRTYNFSGKKSNGYSDIRRRTDEKFLKDFYYHPDVFALHMPSFAMFDELYQCTFVPIQEAATPAATEPTAPAQQEAETPPESVSAESVPV